MARYSAEFLAALRHRYEKTDEPMRALAIEFEIGISTLSALVEKEGWAKRSQRTRDCPPVLGLLAEAKALAEMPPVLRDRATPGADAPTPAISAVAAEILPPPSAADTAHLTPVERLEALVTHYIAREEATRAELECRPRTRGETEHSARTLSTLTQTLRMLQSMKPGGSAQEELTDDDDMPQDLDEFRLALARRIDAFVASRPDEADAACVRSPNAAEPE